MRIHPVAVAIVGAAILAGCQPDGQRPAVSLDQARQITAQFQGQGFQPPPRTISDIAAILDQQRPDPARVAELVAKAEAPPPAGPQSAAMAQFFFERANAASELGRAKQRLEDTRRAYEIALAVGVPPQTLHRYRENVVVSHRVNGQMRDAFALGREAVAAAPPGGMRIAAQSIFVTTSIFLGELQVAREELGRMGSNLTEIQSNPRMPGWVRAGAEGSVAVTGAVLAHESGQFAEAERQYRRAIAVIQPNLRDEANIARQANLAPNLYRNMVLLYRGGLAQSILRQGRLVEAEVEARSVLLGRLAMNGRYATETLNAVLLLADVLIEQGRFSEAERLARVAVDSLDAMKFDPTSALYGRPLRQIARAQSQRGEWEAAARTYADLRARLSDNPDVLRAAFDRNPNWAMVALRTGQAAESERVMTAVVARNVEVLGERHWDTAMGRGLLAAAKLARGDVPGALSLFDAAIPILLQSSRQSDDEETGSVARDAQVKMIFEAAMGALARSGRADAAAQAFRLADAVRGQGVQRALAQSSARAAAADPALADLVRREQDTQKQVGALQGLLTNVLAAAERDEAAVGALRQQIDSLRSARAALRGEIERRFPSYAQLIDPRPATIEDARRGLRPGEALIATYVGRERSFVWAVPQAGAPAFAAVDKGQRAIAEAVANLRKALDPNAATLGDIPVFDVGLAHALYNDLLKPIEAGFADANSLLVVPHDALGQLPFGVLVSQAAPLRAERPGEALFANYKDVAFLIRKAAITQLPSVAALSTLRGLPVPPADRRAFVGFGDPWFSPQQAAEAKAEAATQSAQLQTRGLQTRGLPLVRRNAPTTQTVDSAELGMLPRLPDTADEVKGIALALNADAADVILGAQANERTVKAMDLSNRRVVMFATHGLIPGDLNGLTQPALALSAPDVADVDGDGLLTLDEVLALKLNADWVVLSACNTATGDGAGAEAVSGLGRAFFYAGTRALLVSNWPVETTSARALTTDLFARQARDPTLARAQALREAMTGLIEGPGYVDPASRASVFAYAHPIFWAPFSLVGDGGGNLRQVSKVQ
ncbi:MAG: CHAT domain-containing protein [Azospirillum sp.]|nr:CHAT domain-containing protein [Azospirillum sp.]MCZ8124539.1 CHAT domain-containing protein [Magnetospirillum sp.]